MPDDDQPREDRPGGTPIGRRVVLGLLGLGVLGVLGGSKVQDGLADVLGPVEDHDPTGLVSLLPVGDQFRFYSVTATEPSISDTAFRLNVGGLVKKPLTLTLRDLQAMPQTDLVRDFQCVTGWRVPQVHWSGVALSRVIAAAGPLPDATALRLFSSDGTYTESLTLDQARLPDVIVALRMLGAPVTRDHGGPVRLYVAPMYGYKSLKWLSRIELTDEVVPGYWEDRGYAVNAFVGASNGQHDAPTG